MKLDSIDHLLQDMTELHTHLSTSVSTHLLWELAHQQGITLPEKNYWKFMDMVTISGAVDYAKFHTFFDLNQMIQSSPMGVEKSFYEAVGLGYRKCDIRYGEIKVNPMKRNKDGLFDLDKIIFSAIVGMQRAMMEYPVKGGVIIEMDRRFPLHMNEVIARKAISFAGKGVLWLDISGPTPAWFSFAPLAKIFAEAKKAGLGITVHAWEDQPAQEIFDAVMYANPDRIGHGIQAYTDPRCMELLAAKKILLEICPTSNILTKIFSSHSDFKAVFEAFDQHGVLYTLCADNPSLLQTNVREEYMRLYEADVIDEEKILVMKQRARDAIFLR